MRPDAVLFITRLAPDIHQHLIGLWPILPCPRWSQDMPLCIQALTASRIRCGYCGQQTTNQLEGPGIVRAPSRRAQGPIFPMKGQVSFLPSLALSRQPHDNIRQCHLAKCARTDCEVRRVSAPPAYLMPSTAQFRLWIQPHRRPEVPRPMMPATPTL